MSINSVTQVEPKHPTSELTQQKPASSQQANLFSTQLETSKSNNKLQHAADHSGLSSLANDDNIDSWHSLMGQTYGYDQGDSDSEGYQESEAIRKMVLNNDWPGLGIDLQQVSKGDLGSQAAFVGGDTVTTSDDQILLNGKLGEVSNEAITEELFHSFERKINPEQEGDTRFVNGQVSFTSDESGGALDEGELGRTLLKQFNENGKVPNTLEGVLATGDITSDDTTSLVLNGTNVSAEYLEVPTPPVFDDPNTFDDYFGAISNDTYPVSQINEQFTNGMGLHYEGGNSNGDRDYGGRFQFFSDVRADDNPSRSAATWLTEIEFDQAGSQGIQDYLGWSIKNDSSGSVASEINSDMSGGVGAAFLENFTAAQLNYSETGEDGIKINPEVLQHFPPEELLSLGNDKSMTAAVQDALARQLNDDDYAFDTLVAMHEAGFADDMENVAAGATPNLNPDVLQAVRDHDEELRGNNHRVGASVRGVINAASGAVGLFKDIADNLRFSNHDLLHVFDHSEYAHNNQDQFPRATDRSWFSDGIAPVSNAGANVIKAAFNLFTELKDTLVTGTDIPGDRDYHTGTDGSERLVVGVDPESDALVAGGGESFNGGISGPVNAIKYVFERSKTGGLAWELITSFPYWSNNLASGNTAEDPFIDADL